MFERLIVTRFNRGLVGGILRTSYRVYAVFSDPEDYLIEAGAPFAISSTVGVSGAPGSTFFMPTMVPPHSLEIRGGYDPNSNPVVARPEIQYGTYVTIGVHCRDEGSGEHGLDATRMSAEFPRFKGREVTSAEAKWFTQTATDQGRAGRNGNRVQILQLTVEATSGVTGRLKLGWSHGLQGDRQYSEAEFKAFDDPDKPESIEVEKRSGVMGIVMGPHRGARGTTWELVQSRETQNLEFKPAFFQTTTERNRMLCCMIV